MTRQQYLGMTFLHQWVTLHRFRPMVRVSDDTRGWWEYAYQLATRKPVPRARRRFSARDVVGLGTRRRQYIALYKRVFATDAGTELNSEVRVLLCKHVVRVIRLFHMCLLCVLGVRVVLRSSEQQQETKALREMEARFSYEQCLLFRSLAEAEVLREEEKRVASQTPRDGSTISGRSGGGSASSNTGSGAQAGEGAGWGAWVGSWFAGTVRGYMYTPLRSVCAGGMAWRLIVGTTCEDGRMKLLFR